MSSEVTKSKVLSRALLLLEFFGWIVVIVFTTIVLDEHFGKEAVIAFLVFVALKVWRNTRETSICAPK